MSFEYLLCLGLLLLMSLVLKAKYKVKVFNSFKEACNFYLIVFLIGTIWDNFAVWRGHWLYPGKGILGIFVGLIPLEDYAFAIVTSYSVIVVYKVVQKTSPH